MAALLSGTEGLIYIIVPKYKWFFATGFYIDKLDGTIKDEFWRSKTKEWQQEQEQIRSRLASPEQANRAYFEAGVKILEFANRAYSLYLQQTPREQRRLLNVLLSNCTLTNRSLRPNYKKPFDLLTQRVKNEDWLTFFFLTFALTLLHPSHSSSWALKRP